MKQRANCEVLSAFSIDRFRSETCRGKRESNKQIFNMSLENDYEVKERRREMLFDVPCLKKSFPIYLGRSRRLFARFTLGFSVGLLLQRSTFALRVLLNKFKLIFL